MCHAGSWSVENHPGDVPDGGGGAASRPRTAKVGNWMLESGQESRRYAVTLSQQHLSLSI
jgi:hypothetical protein